MNIPANPAQPWYSFELIKTSSMKLLCIVLLICFPLAVCAQVARKGSTNVSAGVDFLLPSSAFATSHNQGYGVTLKSEYVFARHISATLAGSFYHFRGGEANDINLIPVLAGLRYYVGNFYLGGEAGAGIGVNPVNRNGFMYAFSVGDEIITGSGGNSLDISIRLQNWNQQTTQRFYGLRVAYEFRIR